MAERSLPKYLRFLRDDFSDEIPNTVLHSDSPNNAFKVRRGWWNGLIGCLENGITNGEITDTTQIKEAEAFMDKYCSDDFRHQPLTKPEDITEANRVINLILGETQPGDLSTKP